MKPDKVVILGKEYKIDYMATPSEVDLFKRESLWGQMDPWTRTIRIYDAGRQPQDLLETLLHEVIEALVTDMHLSSLSGADHHDDLDLLALALADTMARNGWIQG